MSLLTAWGRRWRSIWGRTRGEHREVPVATRRWFSSAPIAVTLLLASGLTLGVGSGQVAPPPADGGRIHGAIYATVDGERVPLAGVTVYVSSTVGPYSSTPVQTDIDGTFIIPRQPPDTYALCAQGPGLQTSCGAQGTFVIADETVYLPALEIEVLPPVIAGRVQLTDRSPLHYRDALLGVSVATTVTLRDQDNVPRGSVLVNDDGRFVIGGVDLTQGRLTADFAGLLGSRTIGGSSTLHADILLANSRPIIHVLSATLGPRGVRRVDPGSTVQVAVVATDPEGNALHYRWRPSDVAGGFTSVDAPSVSWTVPNRPGVFYMEAIVDDGRSLTRRTLEMLVGPAQATFSGTVVSDVGAALAGADVMVNGAPTRTDAAGFFRLVVAEADRYVLSIEKFGYALRSNILTEDARDQRYSLRPVTVFSALNPTGPITVSLAGAQITIPANALVDQDNVPATGPLNVSFSKLDLLAPEGQMPGDWAGLNSSGTSVRLVSHGAVDIQIRDNADRRYNLRSGALATLQLAPSNPNLVAPASIAVWSYDARVGAWREEGTATLSAGVYTTTVPHFSVINLDLEKVSAACVRVLVDPSVIAGKHPDLRIEVLDGDDKGRVFVKSVADPISALLRLPPSTNIRLTLLDNDDNPLLLITKDVNTGPVVAAATNLSLPYPYTECLVEVDLTGPPQPKSANGEFLVKRDVNDLAEAQAYYDAIDPPVAGVSQKDTFAKWKTANGFDANVATTAVYFNGGDLAFGRLMSMVTSGTNVAYFVTNFKSTTEAVDFLNGDPNAKPIATVAMEYSPHPSGGQPYTKFFVFDGAGSRVGSANLDGIADRAVPGLCVNCHSGANYSSTSTDPKIQVGNLSDARFLAFDLQSFQYYGSAPYRRADQEAAFKVLNQTILQTNKSPAEQELITGWYPGSTFNNDFVPAGWAGHDQLYKDVVAKYCRSCHTSRGTGLDWNTYTLFQSFTGSIRYDVCTSRGMPHALVTYSNFWFDPTALSTLSGLAGWGTQPCPSETAFIPGVREGTAALPGRVSVASGGGVYPNPTGALTVVPLQLLAPSHGGRPTYQVRAEVFDLAGRRVRRLYDGAMHPGEQRLVWDGRSESGTQVGPGSYLVRVSADEEVILSARVSRVR